MLDLDGKHCGRCGCIELASSPSPPRCCSRLRRNPGPSPLLPPRRCGTRGAGAAGWRGCRSSPEGRRRGGRGRGRSRGAVPGSVRLAFPQPILPGCSGFQAKPPLPCSRAQCSGPAQSRIGRELRSPFPVKRCQVPGFSPRSSLQLGRSDYRLREHIFSLLLSCLPPPVPLPTVLPEGQLCEDWLRQVSVTCHDFAALGKSVNRLDVGKIQIEIPQTPQTPRF